MAIKKKKSQNIKHKQTNQVKKQMTEVKNAVLATYLKNI